MAIEKMKLLSIVGKEEKMDKFIAMYLLDSGLQPEEAEKVYEKGWKLSSYSYNTKAREMLKECKNLMDKLKMSYSEKFTKVNLEYSIDEIIKEIEPIKNELQESEKELENAKNKRKELEETIYPITKLSKLEVDLGKIYELRYIRERYGKVKKQYYEKIEKEIENMNAIMFKIAEENDDIWLMYFTTKEYETNIDSYFNMMKFERIWLPKEREGIPKDIISKMNYEINECKKTIIKEETHQTEIRKINESKLLFLYRQLETLEKVNSLKKYLVHDKKGNFYIIGWIPNEELKEMLPKLKKEKDIQYKVKEYDEVATNPPTYLKNNKLFSKFETIVEMYGTPNYTEIDPTGFVAITAFLMFGFMFGDVGQGLVIAIIGLILMKKKSSLGPVLTAGGISAIIFGFIYGSIFGKEGIIKGIVPSPMENIQNMLIFGIASGAVLIIIAMIFNIKNGLKNKDLARALFDKNGLAGLIFYSIILISVVGLLLNGQMILGLTLSLILIILPLICILFKDNLEKIITKQKSTEKASIVEKIFELIEMLLSMASNTISFVRLAAFAINHVGLCMAVYILSTMVGGAGSLIVAIIGNIIVIVLEGLIVAIQVLRLEYYELFSRFYAGDGKEYIPIESQNN